MMQKNYPLFRTNKKITSIPIGILVFIDKLFLTFPSFKLGTITSITVDFVELVKLLQPYFLFSNICSLDQLLEKAEEIGKSVFFTLKKESKKNNNNLKKVVEGRISNYKNRSFKNLQKINNLKNLINDFFKVKDNELRTEKFRKFFSDFKIRNLLKDNYVTPNCDEIYCIDTTGFSHNCFVTLFTDLGSRKVVIYNVEPAFPSVLVMERMFKRYFSKEMLMRCKMIHLDRSGYNLSVSLLSFFEKLGIEVSYSDGGFGNQVAEIQNRILKDIINNMDLSIFSFYKFYNQGINFDDILPSDKAVVIKEAIKIMNERYFSYNTMYIHKCSRNSLHKSLQMAKIFNTKTSIKRIIVKNGTPESICIFAWKKIIHRSVMLIIRQFIIKSTSICKIQLIYDELFSYYIQLYNCENKEILESAAEELELRIKFIEIIEKILDERGIEFKKDPTLDDKDPIIKIKELKLKKIIINTITKKYFNKKKIKSNKEIQYETNIKENLEKTIFNVELIQNNQTNITKKVHLIKQNREEIKITMMIQKYQKYEIRHEKFMEKAEKGFYKDLHKIIKVNNKFKKIETITIKESKQSSLLNSNLNYAITTEDFLIIEKITRIKEGECEFDVSMRRLAHLFLYGTGMTVDNLKNLKICHIKDAFNGKDFSFTTYYRGKQKIIEFHNTISLSEILKLFYNDYKIVLQAQEDNNKLYSVIDNNSKEDTQELSEIWDPKKKKNLNKVLNHQLCIASKHIGEYKKLTTSSYKRGFLIQLHRANNNALKNSEELENKNISEYNYSENTLIEIKIQDLVNTLFPEQTKNREKHQVYQLTQQDKTKIIEYIKNLIKKNN